MGLRIQNNIAAMNAHRNLSTADTGLSKSLTRLSSGFRINSGADDAAGLAIANAMRADIASFKVATRNASEANSLLQVASGAVDQISNMLTRLKELATQASSANADSNLTKINDEAGKVIDEIDRIAGSTEYADTKLIDGSFGVAVGTCSANTVAASGFSGISGMTASSNYTFASTATTIAVSHAGGSETVSASAAAAGNTKDISFSSIGLTLTINSTWDSDSDYVITAGATGSSSFQIGAENQTNNRIDVSLGNATIENLGSSGTSALTDVDLTTAASARNALDYIDDAISDLATVAGDIGAFQNRLSFAAANLATTIENTQAAESIIRDVDMAAEMTQFTKNQILMQAGTAMLAQANQVPQQILQLMG